MRFDPNKHHRRSIRLKNYDYSNSGFYFITLCTQNKKQYFGHINNGNLILNHAGRMVEKWYYELENKYPDKRCLEMIVMPNHFHCIIENISVEVPLCGHLPNKETEPSQKGTNEEVPQPRYGPVRVPLRGHPLNKVTEPSQKGTNEEVPQPRYGPVRVPLRGHPLNKETEPSKKGTYEEVPQLRYGPVRVPLRGHLPNKVTEPSQKGTNEEVPQPRYGPDNKKYNATIGDAMDWFKTMTTNEYIRGVKQLGWQRFEGKLWQRDYYEHIIRNERAFENISNYIKNNPANWDKDKMR